MDSQAISFLYIFSRIFIGFAFGYASIAKMLDVRSFQNSVISFQLAPKKVSNYLAVLFVGGEIAVVVMMVTERKGSFLGFIFASMLLLIFSLALISILRRNILASCNCFGSSNEKISSFDVWRNLGLLAFSVIGAYTSWLLSEQDVFAAFEEGEMIITALLAIASVLIWVNMRPFVKQISSLF